MFVLPNDMTDIRFPPVEMASPEGLLAVGGDLSNERLLQAYRQGIFPWFNEGQPILWWSPDPRAVLFPGEFKCSRSLRKNIKRGKFKLTADTYFKAVIDQCAGPRPQYPEGGTWITGNMLEAYMALHKKGIAHSIEVWLDNKLVGGLYGLSLGRAFFGESMFSHVTDASKLALAALCQQCLNWQFRFIDCQVPSDHLVSLGAVNIRRVDYIKQLDAALKHADRVGLWSLDASILLPFIESVEP